MYYISAIFYVLVQNIPKISILLLYLRLFPTPRFRTIVYIALAWQVAHTIAFLGVVIFPCIPVESIWDLLVPKTRCINVNLMTYWGAGLSIFEDFVIMLLPVYELWGLKLGTRKKVGLGLMFILASS
jgi:hypothetical protein